MDSHVTHFKKDLKDACWHNLMLDYRLRVRGISLDLVSVKILIKGRSFPENVLESAF